MHFLPYRTLSYILSTLFIDSGLSLPNINCGRIRSIEFCPLLYTRCYSKHVGVPLHLLLVQILYLRRNKVCVRGEENQFPKSLLNKYCKIKYDRVTSENADSRI